MRALCTAGQAGEGLTIKQSDLVYAVENTSQRKTSAPGEDLRVLATEPGPVSEDLPFSDLHAATAELPQARHESTTEIEHVLKLGAYPGLPLYTFACIHKDVICWNYVCVFVCVCVFCVCARTRTGNCVQLCACILTLCKHM